ncbi:MAG: hypothetical protein AAGU74_12820 [Bacillota bacterium]
MTEKKLKSILQEHPYLIDGAFVRSRSEAARLARESSVTIEEFIERSKMRSPLPTEAWDAFSVALAKKRAHGSAIKPSGKPDVLPFFSRKPVFMLRAVAVLVVLLALAAFFTMTKPGIAAVEAAYEIIVKLFDGGLAARNDRETDEPPAIDFEKIPEHVETHEQAAKAIGRPVASIDPADAELVEIMVDPLPPVMVMLRTEYRVKENTLFLEQAFYAPGAVWGSSKITAQIELETELQDGNAMYIGYMDDGAAFGYAYSRSYNIYILSKGIDINELRDIAAKMRFFE